MERPLPESVTECVAAPHQSSTRTSSRASTRSDRYQTRELLVVIFALGDLGKGNVLSDVGDFDGDTLAALGIRDNDDEATLDTRDAVSLIANIFDFDGTLLAFGNRWRARRPFAL